MSKLVIEVSFTDDSDLDWIRNRAVLAVEDIVIKAEDEKRLDGTCEVSWDVED